MIYSVKLRLMMVKKLKFTAFCRKNEKLPGLELLIRRVQPDSDFFYDALFNVDRTGVLTDQRAVMFKYACACNAEYS